MSTRTAAATAARQRIAAERAAIQLGVKQLDHLPDNHLIILATVLISEIRRRGLHESPGK